MAVIYDENISATCKIKVCCTSAASRTVVLANRLKPSDNYLLTLMFIGPCIILVVEQRETNLMSLALLFLHLMLNMFRMLIHPSSAACDLFVELFHGLY